MATMLCPTCRKPLKNDQLGVARCYNKDCAEYGLTAHVDQPIDRRARMHDAIDKIFDRKAAWDEVKPKYNAEAVQKAINKDKRIGGKEAKLIHALLKGRTGDERRYPSYTTAELEKAIAAGRGTPAMEEEVAARKVGASKPRITPQIVPLSKARDTSPFDRDTDKGAERIVKRESKAGKTAKQIAKEYGFSLSFVEEAMGGKAKDVQPV